MNADARLALLGRRGACTPATQHLFFPPPGSDGHAAKAICATCPVAAECLDYALSADERHGVWGGLNEAERDKLRRSQGRKRLGPRPEFGCGTPAAYRRHLRHGETPCEPCRQAHARQQAEAARKAAAS